MRNLKNIATLALKVHWRTAVQAQRRYSGRRYRSGNILVDWIFLRFIDILNKRIKRVVYRTPLRDPDTPRKRILGIWMRADFIRQFGKDTIVYEDGVLYIDPHHHQHTAGDEDTLSTFIHELCHILFSDVLHERSIARAEKLLFNLLSPAQKKALARFLPKQSEAN